MIAGVRVNIMIWDEIDSGHDFLAYTRVSKLLHGGGATEYFQKTNVSVKLMPRKSAAPQVNPPQCSVNSTLLKTADCQCKHARARALVCQLQ